FQAEDGIRDFHVTGVQTCALPISGNAPRRGACGAFGLVVRCGAYAGHSASGRGSNSVAPSSRPVAAAPVLPTAFLPLARPRPPSTPLISTTHPAPSCSFGAAASNTVFMSLVESTSTATTR